MSGSPTISVGGGAPPPYRGSKSGVEGETRAMQELATAARRRVVRDLEAIRGFATRHALLPIVFFLFLASLFLFTNLRVNRDFFYVAVLPLGLLLLPSLQPGSVLRTQLWRISVAYLAFFVVAVAWSPDPSLQPFIDVTRRGLLVAFFLVLTAGLALADPKFEARLFKLLALVAAVAAVVSAIQFYATHPPSMRLAGIRVFDLNLGASANANVAAPMFTTVLLGLLVHGILGNPDRRRALFWSGVALVLLAFLVAGGSRGSLIALAAALLVFVILLRHQRLLAIFGLALAGIGGIVLAGLGPTRTMIARGSSGRSEIWERAIELIGARPILGYGTAAELQFPMPSGRILQHPHNMYFEHLLHGGIGGLLLLLALLAAVALLGWRNRQSAVGLLPLAIAVSVAVKGLVGNRLYIGNADATWIEFWLPMGLFIAREVRARGLEMTGANRQPLR